MLQVEQEAPTPLSFAQAHSAQLNGGSDVNGNIWGPQSLVLTNLQMQRETCFLLVLE